MKRRRDADDNGTSTKTCQASKRTHLLPVSVRDMWDQRAKLLHLADVYKPKLCRLSSIKNMLTFITYKPVVLFLMQMIHTSFDFNPFFTSTENPTAVAVTARLLGSAQELVQSRAVLGKPHWIANILFCCNALFETPTRALDEISGETEGTRFALMDSWFKTFGKFFENDQLLEVFRNAVIEIIRRDHEHQRYTRKCIEQLADYVGGHASWLLDIPSFSTLEVEKYQGTKSSRCALTNTVSQAKDLSRVTFARDGDLCLSTLVTDASLDFIHGVFLLSRHGYGLRNSKVMQLLSYRIWANHAEHLISLIDRISFSTLKTWLKKCL